MKRFAIVLAICMLLPLNAFALELMSEDIMGEVTGQAGVSIAVDDIKLYQNIEYISYTDGDGVSTGSELNPADPYVAGSSASIELTNLFMMVNINAITHLGGTGNIPISPNRGVLGTYELADMAGRTINYYNNDDDTEFDSSALTIDVGDMAILSEGLSYNVLGAATGLSVVGVRIGLPTVEVHQTALQFDVSVTGGSAGALGTTEAVNSGKAFGTIAIGNNTMAVLDGFVEIAPH